MEEEKEIPQQNYDDTDFKNINIILNTISLFSTLILAIILVVLRFKLNKRPKWLNYRTLFYTIFFIVITYIFLAIFVLLQCFIMIPCKISDLFITWFYNQSTFLATTVSFFLLFRRFNPSIYYCLIPVVLALVSGGVSIIFDPYNATENECWYTTDSFVPKDHTGSIILFIIPQLLCILFNISTFIYFMCSNSNITNQVPISFILYPLIPFFSQLGSIICQLRFYSNLSWNESLIGFALISNNIAGFFMLLLFFVGPFLWVKIRKWKRQNNHWGLLFWSGKKKRDYDHDDNHSDINSKSDITLNHSYHQHQHQQQRQPANIIYQSGSSTKSSMKKNHSHNQNNNNKNKNNNNLLSIRSSMTSLNTFIENDPSPPPHHAIKKDDLLKYPPTSLQLEEADLVDMFTKTPTTKGGFTIDITSNSLSSQATTIAVSPTSPTAKFLAPICYEMEDAVPWRVLEADESEDESEEDDIIIYQQKDILNPPSAVLTTTSTTSITNSSSFLSKRYSTVPPPPRISSSTNRSSIYNPRKESWLALYDDDLINDNNNDDEENQSHASNSLHSVSQWLSKRGDSLDVVREQVGRTSKSIRRWCKQQQQFNHHQEMDSMESGLATTAATTSHHTGLHVVQEEQP